MSKNLLVIYALLLITSYTNAQITKLYPIDESGFDSSLTIFKNDLINAIDEKDSAFIVSILIEDVFTSFGGDGGKYEFSKMYLDPENSHINFWQEMKLILELGGTFSEYKGNKFFTVPYVSSKFPSDKVYDSQFPGDIVDCQIVIKDKVNVHEEPQKDSKVIAILSYDIVWAESNKNEKWNSEINAHEWIYIILDDKVGYIFYTDVRTYTDYRCSFIKRNGTWLIESFVAGG